MKTKLIASLRSSAEGMTPALFRIAEYVLANPEAILSQSITELAEASHSSEASVMRFCRDQNFTGFGDFKLGLAKELASDAKTNAVSGPQDDVQSLVAMTTMALGETEQMIDRGEISVAAQHMLSANTIECFGVGASSITAQYMTYKMVRIGKHSRAIADSHLATMTAGTCDKSSVFVVISSSGSTLDVMHVAKKAREQGAYVIGICNRSKSPLVGVCNLSFIAAYSETPLTGGALASKVSQLLIVDALIVEMASQDPKRQEMVKRTAEAVSDRTY